MLRTCNTDVRSLATLTVPNLTGDTWEILVSTPKNGKVDQHGKSPENLCSSNNMYKY